ncbi:MAG TPA: hypothetical protein PKK68_12535, partial [Methanothrix soehngenii]|nr:hypothetical protein [Methanothrix soehngenii]
MPRKSPFGEGGSNISQGRLRISGTSEAMTRNRREPTGTAVRIFSQNESQPEVEEPHAQCPLGLVVFFRPVATLEENGKTARDLTHRLALWVGEALVASNGIAIEENMIVT